MNNKLQHEVQIDSAVEHGTDTRQHHLKAQANILTFF
jgi:hypothetical protein